MTRWPRPCKARPSFSRRRRRSCRSSSKSSPRSRSLVAPDTILASNSSAIPSTEIGRHLKHRERVIGTHFWNPPHLVPLVEVIQNEKTSDDVVRADDGAVARRRKNPGACAPRRAGLRRQPAAACDEARGDRAGRRRRLRCRDDRHRRQARVSARAPPCLGRWSSPILSAPISISTSPRCCMPISTARRAASVPARQGRGRQARHENRRRLAQLDAGASRRRAHAAVAVSRRTGEGAEDMTAIR